MSHLTHIPTTRAAVAGFVAAFLFLSTRGAAVPPADPVEELRLALPFTGDEKSAAVREYRAETLEKRVNALRTLSDLRRALALTEWKDMPGSAPEIRAIDAAARKKVGDRFEAAVKAIVEKGDPNDPAVATARLAVAKMIGEIGSEVRSINADDLRGFGRSLAPYLIRLMKDRNPEVRAAAARALGHIFPDPALAAAAFKAMLRSDGVAQRRAAADGLASMVQKVSELEKTGRQQTGVEAGRKDVIDADAAVLQVAGPGLEDRDARVRAGTLEAVLRALQTFRDKVPAPYGVNEFPPEGRKPSPKELKEILAANDRLKEAREVFAPLVEAIAKQGPTLARLVSDRDPSVRLDARKALELIGEVRARLRRLADSVPPAPAGVSLEGQSPVLAVAQKGEEDPLQRALDPGVRAVARGLKDPNPRIRLATVEFLEALGDGAAEALPALLEALEDCDRFVRWASARALGKMDLEALGPGRERVIVPPLARLLRDPDVDVAKTAAGSLQRFGPPAAAAVPALAAAAAQGDPEVRIAAMNALGALNPDDAARAVPALITALGHSDADVRRAAAETLGKIGPLARDAVEPLRRALRDDNPAVRRAASDALLSILPPPGLGGGK